MGEWDKQAGILKNTYRENTLSNKTRALRKSMNNNIWVIGALNQLFKRFLHSN